jgi:hypothetical protein
VEFLLQLCLPSPPWLSSDFCAIIARVVRLLERSAFVANILITTVQDLGYSIYLAEWAGRAPEKIIAW